jgi:hypothetical protein
MDNAGANLEKAQANLEQWFNDAMDRVSGVYKRKSQVWVVGIAIIVTVFANVDSLQVADTLSHDKALRETLVAAAPELAKADKDAVNKERGITEATASPSPSASPAASPSTALGGAKPNPSVTPSPTPSLSTIKASIEELKKFGLPIGYIRVCTPGEEKLIDNKCPNKVDAAVIDAEAALKRAQDDLEKANTALQKTDGDKSATQAGQSLAAAQVEAAKVARDQATKAAATTKQVEADAVSAEARAQSARTEAQADPQNADKQKAAAELESAGQEARRKADNQKEMLRVECPKCRKESELSANELKQRLPTTHGYHLFTKDFDRAMKALLWDSYDLLYSHWLGWLLTAMAISLGAPFWFDTLNRLMVIRSTIKPQEKSQKQKSKDNPEDKDQSETEKS